MRLTASAIVKVIALPLAHLLLVLPLSACAPQPSAMAPAVALTAPPPATPTPDPLTASCAGDGRTLRHGFYAFFAPVSHSADADPDSAGYREHRGYEADLLTALEALPDAGLAFRRHPIPEWPDIWLKSAGDEFDTVGGGITILDSRTRDAAGNHRVNFTSGHIAFRQSLLVRAEDAARLPTHAALTGDVRVGVLPGTTGEARLLQLVGLAGDDGALAAGTRISTAAGEVTADGSAGYYITAAGAAPELQYRRHLLPPSDDMPQVIYLGDRLGEAELLDALADGSIDAIARGEIGNRDASHASNAAFVVTALDADAEYGGFTLSVADADLLACIDAKINWLTDNRSITYADWRANPNVFLQRAGTWGQ